jgi:hypothetical protein
MDDKKRIGLIISYYLSRCDIKAVNALGYKNFTEAFKEIGDIINENPNNLKNMRDEFDPYFDNRRKGWYQRPLRASRQEIYEEFSSYSDVELYLYIKALINNTKRGLKMESVEFLRDLGVLIRQSTIHFNQDFTWCDVELTNEFKEAYEEYLDKNNWKIEFFNATSVITTPTTKNIFVPNQWFVIASYAVGVYSELHRYKSYFEKISDAGHKRRDEYAKYLRDSASSVDKVEFISKGKDVILMECAENEGDKAVNRLWRFATDYSWWSGQKTVDRGDFYVSVVLNMFNLVNVSQGYVGDIVSAYGSDKNLKRLTKNLDAFTVNMEGKTYEFDYFGEVTEESVDTAAATLVKESLENDYGRHRIKISSSSLNRMGGN